MISTDRKIELLKRFKAINLHLCSKEGLKEWANWLLETNIPQGKNYLCDSEKRACCLGIFVANKLQKDITEFFHISFPSELPYLDLVIDSIMPENLSWFDTKEGHLVKTSWLNDEAGLTFEEIAFLLMESERYEQYKAFIFEETD